MFFTDSSSFKRLNTDEVWPLAMLYCFIYLSWLIERGGSGEGFLKESHLTGAQAHCPAITAEVLQQCSAGTGVSKNMPRANAI